MIPVSVSVCSSFKGSEAAKSLKQSLKISASNNGAKFRDLKFGIEYDEAFQH